MRLHCQTTIIKYITLYINTALKTGSIKPSLLISLMEKKDSTFVLNNISTLRVVDFINNDDLTGRQILIQLGIIA